MDFFGFNLSETLITLGYIGLFGIIFAESGLLIGFFLPGDSLLFTAGLLASQGYFNIWVIVLGCLLAAVLGDNVGYWFGQKVGPKLFRREDSVIFHKDHVKRARDFYEKYGPRTIILARFMPVVRTFAPIVAGIAQMHYLTFLTYNFIGALIWAVGIPLLGNYLGSVIPDIDRYIVPGIIVIVVTSIIPPWLEFLKHRRRKLMEKIS